LGRFARRCAADLEAVVILSNPGLANSTAEAGHSLAYARAQAAAARAMELQQQSDRMLAEAQAVQQTIADAQREQ
jgi:hypothetical protein